MEMFRSLLLIMAALFGIVSSIRVNNEQPWNINNLGKGIKDDPVAPPNYGQEFFNSALGTNQTIRVIVPAINSSTETFNTVYFLHSYDQNMTRAEMASYLDGLQQFFSQLMVCLSTKYTCRLILDSACASECLSYIPEVGGNIAAMHMLKRMGITMFADLPYVDPMIIVLADYREGFYTDRISGPPGYFPHTDFGDRAKRLLKGATGAYEAAIIQVVKYVENNYPTTFNRVIFGQEVGGYGAVKMAIKYPSIFIGAASQSGYLNPKLFYDLYGSVSLTLNEMLPAVFDVFGPGTFSEGTKREKTYTLPTDPDQAFQEMYLSSNDPVQLVAKSGATVPIYLDVGSEESSNLLTYNATKNMCMALQQQQNLGEMYIFDGPADASYWVLDIGYILAWLANVADGNNPSTITCDVFPI